MKKLEIASIVTIEVCYVYYAAKMFAAGQWEVATVVLSCVLWPILYVMTRMNINIIFELCGELIVECQRLKLKIQKTKGESNESSL